MGLDARPLFGHVPPTRLRVSRYHPARPTDQRKGHEVGHRRSQTGLSGNAIMLTVPAVAPAAHAADDAARVEEVLVVPLAYVQPWSE